MNLTKALCATALFVLTMLAAVQNVDVLARPVPLGLDWPPSLAAVLELPLYLVVLLVFLAGFALTALFSLREHRARRRELKKALDAIRDLEHASHNGFSGGRQFAAFAGTAPDLEHSVKTPTEQTTEQTMDTCAETPRGGAPEQRRPSRDEEISLPASPPGWGAVLLLSAALALVFSGAVYVVLDQRLNGLATGLGEFSGLAGHLGSAQEEMARSWEQERVRLREELQSLGYSYTALRGELDGLEEQVRTLGHLPGEVRRGIVAALLREAAGRAAFLGTQVEGEQQRETLREIHQQLQTLALELEEGASRGAGGQ